MPSTSAKQHRLMEAVAHDAAFAKRAKIPQSVGRDFVAADKAAGKFKGSTMKFGQGEVQSGAVNQHKGMAGAKDGGNFGVGPLPQRDVPHEDFTAKTGEKPHMEDGMRGAPPAMSGKGRMMQAAPDHGPMGKDHFKRGGV